MMYCISCKKDIKSDIYVIEYPNNEQTTMTGFCYLCVKGVCSELEKTFPISNKVISITPKLKEL